MTHARFRMNKGIVAAVVAGFIAVSSSAIALDLGIEVGGSGVEVGVGVGGVEVDVGIGGGETAGVTAGVNAGATTPVGVNPSASACVGILTNCPASAASTGGQIPGALPGATDSGDVVTRGTNTSSMPGNIVPANQLLGAVVVSADQKVIGIVEDVSPTQNGSYQVKVQIANHLGARRSHTLLQLRPTRINNNQIRINLRLNEFVSRL